MARKVSEIYQQILAEKETLSSLDSLSSTSDAAIWRSIYYVTAVAIATAEQVRDVFQTELLDTAEKLPTGTQFWYAERLLEYQEGYNVVYNPINGAVGYEVVDEDARLLEVATCESEYDVVVLKTAKSDGADGLEALTVEELAAVTAYINDIKFAGTITKVLSYTADLLKLDINVSVNAAVISATGESVTEPEVYPVEDTIDTFIKEYGLENFDSTFQLVKLTDAIQQTPGVNNVVVKGADAKPFGGTEYVNILNTELHVYKAEAGYLQIDPTFPLRDNITYTV